MISQISSESGTFCQGDSYFLDILNKSLQRKKFIESISYINSSHRQLSFFDTEDSPENLLQQIKILLEENRLYKKWDKKEERKFRRMSVPNKGFDVFIDRFILPLITKRAVHQACHGGVKGWSPKSSLRYNHVPCAFALSFDLKRAFENVTQKSVFDFFYGCLDHVNKEDRRNFSGLLTMLCTVSYGEKIGLPQGSQFSVALFNRILYPLDVGLANLSREKEMRFSRWIDDFTLTSPNSFGREEDLRETLGAVSLVNKFLPVSHEKVFYQSNNDKGIYLLGHIIKEKMVLKNIKEYREKNRAPPLSFDIWGEENPKINYRPWS